MKFNFKYNKKVDLFVSFISIAVIIATVIGFTNIVDKLIYIKSLEVIVILLLIANIGLSIYSNNSIFCTYNIFHCIFGLYYTGKILLDLIGIEEFGETIFFRAGTLEEKYKIFILIALVISLISLNLGRLLFDYKIKNRIKENNSTTEVRIESNKYFMFISLIIFIIGIIPTFYILFKKIEFVSNNTYLDVYTTVNYIDVNIWVKLLANFFAIGFIMFISTKPKVKILIGPMTIYIIYILLSVLTGGRKVLFGSFVMILIYLTILYNLKITKKTLAIIASVTICLVIIGQLTVSFRNKYETKNNIGENIVSFISDQSTSVYVLGYAKEFEAGFSNPRWRLLVQPIDRYIKENPISRYILGQEYDSSQTEAGVKNVKSLSYELSYMLNKDAFINGHGLGSAYIAELYISFGIIGIIIGNLLVGIILLALEKKAKSSRFVSFIFLWSIPSLMLIVRENPLEFLVTLDRPIIIYCLACVICKMIISQKVKNKSTMRRNE